mmetsp:Transcript_9651/g.18115  ORF Transcript_9651/g.18115 Transcript_9651/m.18115 type:complete len:450 (-) Transcript_9651:1602-2951(-)
MSHSLKSNKRQRTTVNSNTFLERISLHPDPNTGLIAFEHFQTVFSKFQIAYIPNVDKLSSINNMDDSKLQIGHFADVFHKLIPEDQETWTIETWDVPEEDKNNSENRPGAFLDTTTTTAGLTSANYTPRRGYCSFIVQNDKVQLQRLLEQLPIVHLPVSDPVEITADKKNNANQHKQQQQQQLQPKVVPMNYGPGLWIFFGWNIGDYKEDLQGRGEHTDAIHHDGTFHYQMSGVKDWHVRPTDELLLKWIDLTRDDDELLQLWKKEREQEEDVNVPPSRTKLDIRCSQGDIILINTRLWWHSTTLPPRVTVCTFVPSVSYARDIYSGETNNYKVDNPEKQTLLTNVDGLYAANDIETGTILFRESEMPECELHRTKSNPNCELVELEDGEGAVISCRDVKAGEFFCVLESDDSDSEQELESDDDYNEEDDDGDNGEEYNDDGENDEDAV